ncbi:elongation factor G [Maritimibacter sp. 55A14]|uniref:elongation factor G n=1 Tax=Maritimibacter sp. 55A14 TaxID=2174844 RepID=UPI000D617E8F|nr:elongation factor G [Maritimibacter sp. 55A14]PWE31444.1 elongation factor G [Maritimibacter sp. 55A14]
MRAFTVIGPPHSGNSSLVGALAGLDGVPVRRLGMMGEASVTGFDYMQERWAAFDIPGGLDNVAQIGPALAASDAAVLCAPAEAEAAVLCAPYLRLLEASGVPSFIFINGTDTAADRISDIVAALQVYCAHGIILRQVPIRSEGQISGAIDLISERAWEYREGERSALVELPEEMRAREEEARYELLESLADFDDGLLEQIVEDQRPMTDDLYSVATRVLQHHDLVPAFVGSATMGNGIQRLMKSLRHEVPGVAALRGRLGLGEEVAAVACLADSMKHLGKTVLVRALQGGVEPGARLGGDTLGSLNDLDAKTPVSALGEGELGLTIKSDHIALGFFLTSEGTVALPDWAQPSPPALRRILRPLHERDENKLSAALTRLGEIDTGLAVTQDERSGHLVIGVQGPRHLRRVVDKLAGTFGIKVECEEVPTALCETIRRNVELRHRHRKQSGGAGQFADVVLALGRQPLGSGFAFSDTVKGGAVPRNYIPAVEAGVRDALAEGPAGHPVVDVAATLKDGKAHSVDSSDFAFRTAAKNATKEALKEAGTVILQPIMQVSIDVPSVYAGGLVPLMSGIKGQVLGFEAHPSAAGWDVFRALMPMSVEEELFRSLASATRGTARFVSEPDHYEELREAAATTA